MDRLIVALCAKTFLPSAPLTSAREDEKKDHSYETVSHNMGRHETGSLHVSSVLPCLDGIRVLELGSTIAGPSATRHLADLGAIVLKVEPPGGDQLRTWGSLAPDGTSWWFKSHNRNKRLLTFDLREEEDAAAVRELALDCDVVVENFRTGWLRQCGLDAESTSVCGGRVCRTLGRGPSWGRREPV